LILRILITALAALLAPAGTALAALPQQSATANLAAPGSNPLVYGTGSGEQAGTSVAALGDVNGDGVGDMAVGPLADASGRTDSGSVYVDRGDRVKGCEKRVNSKPQAASRKRRKKKKSSRAGR
jgi:FG-GAP repeat